MEDSEGYELDTSWLGLLGNSTENYSSYDLDENLLATSPCVLSSFFTASWLIWLYILLIVLNILGNVLVLVIMYLHLSKTKALDVFLCMLCLCGLFLVPAIVLKLWHHQSSPSNVSCLFEALFRDFNTFWGIWLMAAIGLWRLMLLLWPTIRAPHAVSFGVIVSGILGLMSLAISLPTALATAVTTVGGVLVCRVDPGANTFHLRAMLRNTSQIAGMIIPFLIMCLCYVLICVRVLKTKLTKKARAVRVLIVIVLAFICLCGPGHVMQLLDTLLRTGLLPSTCSLLTFIDDGLRFGSLLQTLFTAISPFLLAVFGSLFRQRVLGLVERVRRSFSS